jgi:hypothetical protein
MKDAAMSSMQRIIVTMGMRCQLLCALPVSIFDAHRIALILKLIIIIADFSHRRRNAILQDQCQV